MPITITPTSPNSLIGPGLPLIASSDVVGPIGLDWKWIIEVRPDPEDLLPTYGWQVQAFGSRTVTAVLSQKSSAPLTQRGLTDLRTGDTVYAKVELRTSTETVEDSGTLSATWNATDALHVLLGETTTGAGFTAGDRADVQATLAGIRVPIPAIAAAGGSILGTLASLWQGFPANLTSRHSSLLITGQGSVARGSEPFRVDALGMEWFWHTIPPGFGAQIGSVDEYFNRVVQFRLIDQDDSGQLFQSAWIDSHTEGQRHLWGVHQPVTVEWYVAPGCVVELSFLVLALG